jgi:hypothetical protein
MSTVKKPTQRTQFEALIDLATKANRLDLVDFCKGRIEQLDKKNAKSSDKLTPTQIANEGIKAVILELGAKRPMTVSEMMKTTAIKALENDEPFNNQKISALANQLVNAEKMTKETVKGKTYFATIKVED